MNLSEKIANFKAWSEYFNNDTKRLLAIDTPLLSEKDIWAMTTINSKASEVIDYITDVLEDKRTIKELPSGDSNHD